MREKKVYEITGKQLRKTISKPYSYVVSEVPDLNIKNKNYEAWQEFSNKRMTTAEQINHYANERNKNELEETKREIKTVTTKALEIFNKIDLQMSNVAKSQCETLEKKLSYDNTMEFCNVYNVINTQAARISALETQVFGKAKLEYDEPRGLCYAPLIDKHKAYSFSGKPLYLPNVE